MMTCIEMEALRAVEKLCKRMKLVGNIARTVMVMLVMLQIILFITKVMTSSSTLISMLVMLCVGITLVADFVVHRLLPIADILVRDAFVGCGTQGAPIE